MPVAASSRSSRSRELVVMGIINCVFLRRSNSLSFGIVESSSGIWYPVVVAVRTEVTLVVEMTECRPAAGSLSRSAVVQAPSTDKIR